MFRWLRVREREKKNAEGEEGGGGLKVAERNVDQGVVAGEILSRGQQVMRQVYYDGACAVFSSPCLPVTCPYTPQPPLSHPLVRLRFIIPHSPVLLLSPLLSSSQSTFQSAFLFLSSGCLLTVYLSLSHTHSLFLYIFFLLSIPLSFFFHWLSILASFLEIVHPKRHRTDRCFENRVGTCLLQQRWRQCVSSVCQSVTRLSSLFMQFLSIFCFNSRPPWKHQQGILSGQ